MRADTYLLVVRLSTPDVEPCWSLLKSITGTRCIAVDPSTVRRPSQGKPTIVLWNMTVPLLPGRPRILRLKERA